MFGFPMEVVTMLMSTAGGAILKMWSQASKDKADQHRMLIELNEERRKGIEAARNYINPNASWIRRFLVISFMSMAVFILVAPTLGMQTSIPVDVTTTWLFWSKTVTEYVTLDGIVTPVWLGHAILAVVGMYFGSSIVKR